MSELANFLCARPSFLEGASRVIDLGGTLNEYNRSMSGEQADYLALLADWRMIGEEIRSALKQNLQVVRGEVERVKAVKAATAQGA
jgi:hypothetical protein